MNSHYSKAIQKQLDSVGAKLEHWEYRTLPAVRFIGLAYDPASCSFQAYYDGWAETREKAAAVLDTMPEYASGFDYDLTFSHHFGKRVEEERNHDFIGRFMKAGAPVPDGFAHWDLVPDSSGTPYLTFCSQFAFSVLAGDHDKVHSGEGFDVNALYDITRNIILEEKIAIPYPEIYWTAEVQFDRADGTIYNPEQLYNEDCDCACGWLFSIFNKKFLQ